ncbi:MAG: 2-hydroxyacyl-CoA dehydratase family protein [Dehalococcoidia bacterium]|nr:2-hydroxyacyl-CoA dehydratase family protein [Dehalococcoidia bacterium]
MTQEVKTRPLNRLKAMYALRAEVDKMYAAGGEAKAEGRPVAWVMLEGWANPILSAMDVSSVYPENYSSLCAAAKLAGPFLERAESEGYPTHLCGYARTCVGYSARMVELDGQIPPEAPAGGMPKPTLLVSSGEVCDARFKWFQSLGRYFDAPVWTLESPSPGARESLTEGTYERNAQFLISELRHFVNFLEKLLGKKMDWDRLEFTASGTNEINRLRWEINQLRKARPGPMHTRDFWSAMSSALYRGGADPTAIVEGHKKLYDEVKYRVDHGIAGINRPEKYRLAFEGLPPWHSLGFMDDLADRGWNFVCETAYSPRRPIDIDVTKYSDPIERYVRSRYRSLADNIRDEFGAEEAPALIEEVKREGTARRLRLKHIRDYQCDGVILHILLSCRAASSGLSLYADQLMEVYKVPSLIIEGDIIDTSLFNPVEALKKAEAFEDTMAHYRKVRKDLGFEW